MPSFDLDAARKAGHSDADIAAYLKTRPELATPETLKALGTPASGLVASQPPVWSEQQRVNRVFAGPAQQATENLIGLPGDVAAKFGFPGYLPTARDVAESADRRGLQIPYEEPQGTIEHMGAAAARALPGVALGTAADVATGGALTPALLGNTAAGVGGSVLGNALQGTPLGPAAGALAAIPLTMGSRFAEGRALGKQENALTNVLDQHQQTLAELNAKRANVGADVDPATAALSLERQRQEALSSAARAKAKADFDAAKQSAMTRAAGTNAAADATVGTIASAAHPTVETWQQAGAGAQDIARNWLNKTLPTKVGELHDAAFGALPDGPNTPASLDSFRGALKDINNSGGSLENITSLLKPKLPAQMMKEVENRVIDPTKGPVTVGELKQLRTALGDARGDIGLTNDIGKNNLNKLYAALTDDMRKPFETAGLGDQFKTFNDGVERLYSLAEGPVSKIVGGKTPSLALDPEAGKVPGALINPKDATALQALRNEPELSPLVNQLAAAHLKQTPEAWMKLGPETQAALIPDESTRANLTAAFASKAKAQDQMSQELASAKAQRDALTQAAADAKQQSVFAKQQELELAKSQAKSAKSQTDAEIAATKAKADQARAALDSLQKAKEKSGFKSEARNVAAIALTDVVKPQLENLDTLGVPGMKALGTVVGALPWIGNHAKSAINAKSKAIRTGQTLLGGYQGANPLDLNAPRPGEQEEWERQQQE